MRTDDSFWISWASIPFKHVSEMFGVVLRIGLVVRSVSDHVSRARRRRGGEGEGTRKGERFIVNFVFETEEKADPE